MNTKTYGTKEMRKNFGPITFGKALESHRKCEELSQKEFAKALGISSSSLCNLEKGRRIPTPRRAAKIARIIGEPESYWIQLSFQDTLQQNNLNFKVYVA